MLFTDFLIQLFQDYLSKLLETVMNFININVILPLVSSIFQPELLFGISDATVMGLYNVIAGFAIVLLTVKLLWKLFNVYVTGTEGNADTSPKDYLILYVKAIIIIFSFTRLYGLLVGVAVDLLDALLSAINWTFSPTITNSTLFLILMIVYVVMFIILYIQCVMQGVRMLVLRIGIPLACVSLIDGSSGSYKAHIQKFYQTALTVIVQICLMEVSTIPLVANANTGGIGSDPLVDIIRALPAIAILWYAFKVTSDLRDVLLASSAVGIGSKALSGGQQIVNFISRLRK